MTGAVAVAARPAGVDDLATAVDLAARARESVTDARGGDVLLSTDRRARDIAGHLRHVLADDTQVLVLGTLDDVAVGYLLAAATTTTSGSVLTEIEELYVDPEARRVGVGEAMLDHTIDWALGQGSDGIEALALPGDRATKNFFESHGMVARAIIAHRRLTDGPARS